MRLIMLSLAGLLLNAFGAGAADRVGDGVEVDWNPSGPAAVSQAPAKVEAKTEPVVAPKTDPEPPKVEPVKPVVDPVKPAADPVDDNPLKQATTIPVKKPTTDTEFVIPPAKAQSAIAPIPAEDALPLATMSGPGGATTEPRTDDVAGDLPGTVAAKRASPFHVEMEDFEVVGNLSPKVEKTLRSVAELKKLIGLISRDLDAGGVERTRLVFNTEAVAKEVSFLAEIWNNVPPMVSSCVNAKRASLLLEEELRNEPRQWSHVRWAFQDCQKEVKQLRQIAARLAGTAPQLVRVEKKGKVYYVEPSKDAEQARLEQEEKKRQTLKDERDDNRERAQEIKKTKEQIPVNYDK